MNYRNEKPPSSEPKPEPIWGVAANIVEERPYGTGGLETKRGTRKFHGGAKVYMVGGFWGMGGEKVVVVGHFRGKNPYITSVISVELLENFRSELIYSPTIIEKILKPDHVVSHPHPAQYRQQPVSKEEAEQIVIGYIKLAEYWRAFRQKHKEKQRTKAAQAVQSEQTSDDSVLPDDGTNNS